MGDIKRVEEMNYFELIAWLGIGSSHPGGFPATKQNLEAMQIKPEEYVLDAGCGSGLTTCHLAKTMGCKIIGIDISPLMVEKARRRAEREGVSHLVTFEVADIYGLPYGENCFDVVIAESITVFLDKVKVYKECYRVLKPQGRVADLEMAIINELPPPLKQQMEECFGPSTNPLSFDEWAKALSEAGFEDVTIQNPHPMKNNVNMVVNELKKDWIMLKDLPQKIKHQPGLINRLQKNAGFMKQNHGYFGYGLIMGRKPIPKQLPKKTFKSWIKTFLRRFNNK